MLLNLLLKECNRISELLSLILFPMQHTWPAADDKRAAGQGEGTGPGRPNGRRQAWHSQTPVLGDSMGDARAGGSR